MQNLLFFLFAIHSVCLLPINILRISKHLVIETHENSFTFDILYLTMVAIQFASTMISPLCYYMLTSSEQGAYHNMRNMSTATAYELNGYSPSFDGPPLTEADEETACSAE